jgi:hypothetical protein
MATSYYVSQVDGNDTYNGLYSTWQGGLDGPWSTVNKVNGSSFSGDDFIYFKRGCTWREQLTVGQSGTDGHPITYGAYGTGNDPIITGFDVKTGWTNYETGSGDGVGNLIDDNFDDNDISDWTLSGTPTAGSGVVTFNASEYMQKSITGSSEVWVQFSFYAAALPAGLYNLVMLLDGANNHCNMYMETDGDIKIWNAIGSASLDMGYRYVAGTTVTIELHWKKSATVGEIHCWVDGEPTYSNASQNNGTTDTDVVRLGPNGVWTWILDDAKVDNVGYIGGGSTATNYWYVAHTVSSGGVVLENGSPMSYVEWDTDPATTFSGATAPCCSFDDTGDRVYAWCTGNADPATKTMQVSVREHAIAIDGKNYIDVENLDFTGSYRHGGHVTGTCTTINFTDCDFYYHGGTENQGNGFEVNGGTSTLTLTGCRAYQNYDIGYSVQMLTGNGNMSGITLSQCEAYLNRASGFEILQGSGTGTMTNVRVTRCVSRNNDGTGWSGTHVNESGIYVDSNLATDMSSVQLDYNLVYENGIRGLYVLRNSTGTVTVAAYNNAIYDNNEGVVTGGSGTPALTFQNNIVAGHAGYEMNCSTGSITADYNNYYHSSGGSYLHYGSGTYNFSDWKTQSSQDAHSLSTNPLMVAPATRDFTLQSTSPCINAGVDVSLTADYEGTLVPWGTAPDIGAYEWTGGGRLRVVNTTIELT